MKVAPVRHIGSGCGRSSPPADTDSNAPCPLTLRLTQKKEEKLGKIGLVAGAQSLAVWSLTSSITPRQVLEPCDRLSLGSGYCRFIETACV